MKQVIYEKRGAIAHLKLNRPDKLKDPAIRTRLAEGA